MKRLFGGVFALLFALVLLTTSFYFAWASGTPGMSVEGYQQYQSYSSIFGILAIVIFLFGGYSIIAAIRQMNRKYRDEQKQLATKTEKVHD